MKYEEAGMPMGGVQAPTYTQQPDPNYNNQMPSQGVYTSTGPPLQNQVQQSVPQEPYPGGQPQPLQNQPQYPNYTSYPQEGQVSSQSYPSPQGEYPPQYAGSVPQQTSYPEPRDGVAEMHSPTEGLKKDGSLNV